MKLLKKNILIFHVLTFVLTQTIPAKTFAQQSKRLFGLTFSAAHGFPQLDGTYTGSGIWDPIGLYSNYKGGFGAQVGGVFQYKLNKKLGFRTGIGIEWRNYSFVNLDFPDDSIHRHQVYLINVPILLQYWPKKGFALELGAETNMAFKQKIDETRASEFTPTINHTEFLINFGMQFRVYGNSYLGVSARWALAPFARYVGDFGGPYRRDYYTENLVMLHRGLYVSYFYLFNALK